MIITGLCVVQFSPQSYFWLNKSDSHYVVMQCYLLLLHDYRLNWTPLSPVSWNFVTCGNSCLLVFCLLFKVEIAALKAEEEILVQEVLNQNLEVVLLNSRVNLTLRVQMPSLIKKRLRKSYNKNFMKISGLQMRWASAVVAGCKENHFYSLPFGQAEGSIYLPRRHLN